MSSEINITQLNSKDIDSLKESLNFLHVEELKVLADKICLSNKGKKVELIARIVTFLQTGEKLICNQLPAISYAKKGVIYEIAPHAPILKGAYKNDLKTRLFFKKLIGEHFHFTAFGIDWLNERWFNGAPPTYQEFADMWQAEYQKRKNRKAPPKAEWAYIIFTQNFLKDNPKASRSYINNAWEEERQQHKKRINRLLQGLRVF